MYHKFFGLKTLPFNITCDPQFFFESASHREAYASLLYGIKEKKGIILLTGEVGTGKTTLLRTLMSNMDEEIKVSLILNPIFSDVQLLQAIVEDFGLHLEKKSRLDIVNRLNAFLIDLTTKGGTAVVIIDEAQDLTRRQLEQIRLLSNLETSREKLLQIVLSGQPELTEKLKEYRLRQIRQRIFIKYNLEPLRKDEVEEYVQLRIKKSGLGNITITPECYKVIYDYSKGIPRLINILCDRTLLIGYVQPANKNGILLVLFLLFVFVAVVYFQIVRAKKIEKARQAAAQKKKAIAMQPVVMPVRVRQPGEYVLEGIIYSANPTAVINGKVLKTGDKIDNFVVKEITPKFVVLLNADDNSVSTLKM